MGLRWVVLCLFVALCLSGCNEELRADDVLDEEQQEGSSLLGEGSGDGEAAAQFDNESAGVSEGLVEADNLDGGETRSGRSTPPICATGVVSVNGSPPWRPQTAVHVTGAASWGADETELLYIWSLVQPEGSHVRLETQGNPSDVVFVPKMIGTYEIILSVEGIDGLPPCGPTTAVVEVSPGSGIHIEMVWDTPEDPDQSDTGGGVRRTAPPPGADLDLHFAHPDAASWFDSMLDCFWLNPEPDWADKTAHPATYSYQPTITDNPAMTLQDIDGAGPEIITLKRPQEGATYYVGVHYWNDNGYGLSDAQVRIYLDGELSYSSQWVSLQDLDMWEVATLDWSNREVSTMTNYDGDPTVIPNYTNSFLFKIRCSLGLPITPSWLPNQ
jgi:hypothetical protein